MNDTTKYIIEGIVAFVLIGVVGFIIVKIFGKNIIPSNTCPPQTPNSFNGQCFSCDPNSSDCQTCPATPCQNGGTCYPMSTDGTGACSCVAPYFGNNCEKICDSTTPCKNGGQCQNGVCVCASGFAGAQCEQKTNIPCNPLTCKFDPFKGTSHCVYGGPNNCNCMAGWKTSQNSTTWCDTCQDGYGPLPGDTNSPPGIVPCSKKLFTEPILVGTQNCWDQDYWGGYQNITNSCQGYFGDASTYAGGVSGYKACGTGCSIGSPRPLCIVPKYWADPSFVPSSWSNCPSDQSSYDEFKKQNMYGFGAHLLS